MKPYKSLTTLQNAAEHKRSLTRDQYAASTAEIISSSPSTELHYHTEWHSKYCAVKRKAAEHNIQPPQSTQSKATRSHSDITPSDDKGILVKKCILCSQARKRSKHYHVVAAGKNFAE